MPTSLEQARASIIGRRSQLKGSHGETYARWALESYGVAQVCRIHTGWRIKRVGKRIVSAQPIEKVSADWRGVWNLPGYQWPKGASVMAEAKERTDLLIYSDLEQHQHFALSEHAQLGGASFVVAIYQDRTVAILPYPCVILRPRAEGLTSEMARKHACWWRIAP